MEIAVIAVLVFAAAMSGAVFKPGAWYETLRKPSWTPANWVFPVVWTPLYIMIAVSGWMVWREAGLSVVVALWGLQLLLNAAWSGFFFGLKRMDWAFVDVIALWLSVALYIPIAAQISLWAGLLFAPYLVWVTIAAALNWRVWRLNQGMDPTTGDAEPDPGL